MEKISLKNIEMGNLLFGHSRGLYQVPRDWQDFFVEFLEDNGFDFYGYVIDKDLENKFGKLQKGKEDIYKHSEIDPEEIIKNGSLIKELNEEEIEYLYQGKRYLIISQAVDEYDDDFERWLEAAPDTGDERILDIYNDFEPQYENYPKKIEAVELFEKDSEMNYFDNGTFVIRPYYWGESEELCELPNFEVGEFKMSWYKYPLRDSYCNIEISEDDFKKMLLACKESLKMVEV